MQTNFSVQPGIAVFTRWILCPGRKHVLRIFLILLAVALGSVFSFAVFFCAGSAGTAQALTRDEFAARLPQENAALEGMADAVPVERGELSTEEEMEIMAVDDLERGMTGYARTVAYGTEVESFSVEIMSVLRGQGMAGDLIMIEASGEVIDRSGGIAAGMSGSPIYIDGKLVGAISYGWQDADHRIGLATPAAEMKNVAGYSRRLAASGKTYELQEPVETGDREITTVHVAGGDEDLDSEETTTYAADDAVALFTPVETPIMLSGLSGRAREYVSDELDDRGLWPLQGGGAPANYDPEEVLLEPGSAIGVQLMRGDIEATSIGTLTFMEGREMLVGFGHPFMNRGSVDLMLTSAYIHHVMESARQPFKIGGALELIGRIDQDRPAAISGRIGRFPHITSLRVRVEDEDLGHRKHTNVQLIQDEDMFVSLLTGAALQAVDQSIERIGKGVADIEFKISGRNIPGDGLERKNKIFSFYDVAAASLHELMEGIGLLLYNRFQEVDIYDVTLEIAISERNMTATIEDIEVQEDEIQPGGTLPLEVILRPYRQEPIVKEMELEIPEDAPEGEMMLAVYGGYHHFYVPEEEQEREEDGEPHIDYAEDFHKEIEMFEDRPMNNELIARLFPVYPQNYQERRRPVPEVEEEIPEEPELPEEPPDEPEEPEEDVVGAAGPEALADAVDSPGSGEPHGLTPEAEPPEAPPYHIEEEEEEWFEIKESRETPYVVHGNKDLEIYIVTEQSGDGSLPGAGIADFGIEE